MSIFVSRLARRDLDEALSYLDSRSSEAARRLASRIDALLRALDGRIFEGPYVTLKNGRTVRSWPLPPFRIYYERRGTKLYVLRIYHSARRPLTK